MHARRGNTLVAFKLATVAFLMPATAGLSAQTPLQWPANSAQRPAVEQTAPGNTSLDNYLQQPADIADHAEGDVLIRVAGARRAPQRRAGQLAAHGVIAGVGLDVAIVGVAGEAGALAEQVGEVRP